MKQVYEQIVQNLNKNFPEYKFELDMFEGYAFIYVYDDKDFIYQIDIERIVSGSKITNPNKLYRICLIILEDRVGV